MNTYRSLKLFTVMLIGIMFLSFTTKKSNEKYILKSRKFQGIPSLAVSQEGRMWAVWYAGITPKGDAISANVSLRIIVSKY